MHLNGFLHPGPTSITHLPEKDLVSLYHGSQVLQLIGIHNTVNDVFVLSSVMLVG